MYKTLCNNPIEREFTTYSWAYWDQAFSDLEIENIKEYCEKREKYSAKILGTTDKKKTEKVRISDINFIQINQENSLIFDKFNQVITIMNDRLFNYNLNGYDSFQYTEYDSKKKAKYDWHQDIVHGPNNQFQTR